jgi:hypothetical protein
MYMNHSLIDLIAYNMTSLVALITGLLSAGLSAVLGQVTSTLAVIAKST